MRLLKEIVDFYRFFWKTSKAEKTIVFYAEHESYYTFFEGLINKLIDTHNQTLCYVTSDINDPILQKPEPRTFYLNRLLPFFMIFVNCKVFMITLTDLNQYHLKRSINPVYYIYVFHSLVSAHMAYRYGAFDHYDSILCCGPYQVEEIRRQETLYNLPRKKLVEAGYYRLERIYEAYQKHCANKTSSFAKKTILIAPSWGVSSILELCGERLINILLDAGYNVIARPHPETVKRFHDLVTMLVSEFGNNPNFILEKSVATDDSILRADILITDYSGIAFEYAFGTERPVLFLDVPVKIGNKKFKELDIEPLELSLRSEIGLIVSFEELGAIPLIISTLIAERLNYKTRIAELRKRYIYAFRHSSDVGVRHILEIIENKLK